MLSFHLLLIHWVFLPHLIITVSCKVVILLLHHSFHIISCTSCNVELSLLFHLFTHLFIFSFDSSILLLFIGLYHTYYHCLFTNGLKTYCKPLWPPSGFNIVHVKHFKGIAYWFWSYTENIKRVKWHQASSPKHFPFFFPK